jgi:hypothetical protein
MDPSGACCTAPPPASSMFATQPAAIPTNNILCAPWAYYTVFSGAGVVSGTLHPAV